MRAELDTVTNLIALDAPTTAAELVRQIPGARHDSKRQLWLLPLSWASCVTMRGVLAHRLEVGPDLADWARKERATHIDPALALRAAQDVEDSGLDLVESEAARDAAAPLHLRPYQRAGAVFLATAETALLGDEMRLGKTGQAIRAVQLLDNNMGCALPALVVTPNSVKAVWGRELAKWWPDARVVVAGSGTAQARKAAQQIADGHADVLVVNYEALPNLSRLAGYGSIQLQGCTDCDALSTRPPSRCERSDKDLNLIPWKTVIADEVHRAKSPTAKQTRALWALGDKATYRFGLTGTPPSDPADFWTLMRFVSPREFPGKTAWVDRYVLTVPNFYSGFRDTVGYKAETRDELNKFVLPHFIRRTRAMVFPDDIPPIYLPRYVELAGKQKKAYDTFRKELLAMVDGGVIWTASPLTKLLRLRQLASAYAEVEGDDITLSEPSSKLDVFEEVLEELGENQAVVFAESRQLIELAGARLEKREIPFGYVTGGQTPEARALDVEKFQRGDHRYLLCTVQAGGEGLTMDAADTAIFLQRPWSDVLNAQAEARIQMPGTDAHTTIIELITTGTVDEAVGDALAEKAAKLEDLVQDEDTLRRWLS